MVEDLKFTCSLCSDIHEGLPDLGCNSPDYFNDVPEDERRARGLNDGDTARVVNEYATLTMRVAVSDMTPPGVGWAPKGRWPSAAPEGLNVNALNPGLRSDMGNSTALHGVEVTVSAA